MTLLLQVSELYRPEVVLCQPRLGTARAKNAGTALQDIGHLLHQRGFLNAAPPPPIPANSAVHWRQWGAHGQAMQSCSTVLHTPANPTGSQRLHRNRTSPEPQLTAARGARLTNQPARAPTHHPGKHRLHNLQWLCYLSVSISPESCFLPSAGRGSKKSRIQNILWTAKPLERSMKWFTAFYNPSEKAS